MELRFIIALCIALITVSAVSASFEVSYEIVENRILSDETAYFTFELENELSTTDRIRITVEDIDWIMRSDPRDYYFTGIRLAPGERERFTLSFRPTDNLDVGNYRITFWMTSDETGERQTIQVPVSVTRPDGTVGEYLAAVSRLLEFPSEVDPRDDLTITVNLNNRNARNISDFTVFVESDVFTVSETTSLGPLESKRLEFDVELPDDLEPQTFTMTTSFRADGRLLRERFYDDVEIIAYESIAVEESKTSGFFRNTRTYTYVNDGNAAGTAIGSAPVNAFSRVFSAVRIDDDRTSKTIVANATGTYLTWSVPLGVGESSEVDVTANYSLLFWLAIIALAGVLVWVLMRSPISVRKDAVVVGVSEGGISEIRVVVHIKNLSPRRFINIAVIDSIPKIAEYVPDKEENMHTLRVYTNQREGSIVKWSLETLERYEERILTYRIRSKLSIVGGINLPRTLARFTDDSGQEQVTRSNSERVSL